MDIKWIDEANKPQESCTAFVNAALKNADIEPSRGETPGSYKNWGQILGEPVYGCIAVFDRHVGFVIGVDERGRLMIFDGTVNPFPPQCVISYRWPHGVDLPRQQLPIINKD